MVVVIENKNRKNFSIFFIGLCRRWNWSRIEVGSSNKLVMILDGGLSYCCDRSLWKKQLTLASNLSVNISIHLVFGVIQNSDPKQSLWTGVIQNSDPKQSQEKDCNSISWSHFQKLYNRIALAQNLKTNLSDYVKPRDELASLCLLQHNDSAKVTQIPTYNVLMLKQWKVFITHCKMWTPGSSHMHAAYVLTHHGSLKKV